MAQGFIAQKIEEAYPGSVYVINDPTPKPVISITTPPQNNIVFHSGNTETLRIAEDGFYVRGKKVPADEDEAAAVYRAFKQWIVETELRR